MPKASDGVARVLKRRLRSKQQVIEAAKFLGVDRTTIYNWRSGRRTPGLEEVTLLARYLGVTLDELTGFDADDGVNWVEVVARLDRAVGAAERMQEESLRLRRVIGRIAAILSDLPKEVEVASLNDSARDLVAELAAASMLLSGGRAGGRARISTPRAAASRRAAG
jgi:transcriptional regulator with XRE-family HTH domain